jgi:hypothetical protein
MGIFHKKSEIPRAKIQPDEVSHSVAHVFRQLGRGIAQKLSSYEHKMSLKHKKITVTLFCVLTSMIWMTELYHGLYSKPSSTTNFFAKPGISTAVTPRIPDSILFKVQRLRQLRLDSLKQHK